MGLQDFILNCEKDNKQLRKDIQYYKNKSQRLQQENQQLKEQLQQQEEEYDRMFALWHSRKLIKKFDDEFDEEDKKKAISCIKKTKDGKQIDVYDKLKAIDMLVKYMKLFDNVGEEKSAPTLNIVVKDNSNLEKVLFEEEEK